MTCRITNVLLGTALLCAPGFIGHVQTQTASAPPAPTKTVRAVPNFVTVTDQTMRAPKPEDWLIHRGNYQAWGYSPLDQINKTNVKTLQLVWSRAMEPGINQATPLVYNGVMYLGQSRRRDPGDRCRDRRPHVGVPAPAAASRRRSAPTTDSASAASRSMATTSTS